MTEFRAQAQPEVHDFSLVVQFRCSCASLQSKPAPGNATGKVLETELQERTHG